MVPLPFSKLWTGRTLNPNFRAQNGPEIPFCNNNGSEMIPK